MINRLIIGKFALQKSELAGQTLHFKKEILVFSRNFY